MTTNTTTNYEPTNAVMNAETTSALANRETTSALASAPTSCHACAATTAWGTSCRYCSRYRRPCGRHDGHAHEAADPA